MKQSYWEFRETRDREFRRARLSDVERALEDCRERSDANAARDPESLTLIEIQQQFHSRIGPGRGCSDGESWGLRQALEFGRLLAVVKQRVGHGDFERWVRAFCPFAPRTAARYVRAARGGDV